MDYTVHGVAEADTTERLSHSTHANYLLGFPCSSVSREAACSTGDMGSIPVLERSPGEGNGNPLQYSCLENPMDRGTW